MVFGANLRVRFSGFRQKMSAQISYNSIDSAFLAGVSRIKPVNFKVFCNYFWGAKGARE
jgi:hypothetical protein